MRGIAYFYVVQGTDSRLITQALTTLKQELGSVRRECLHAVNRVDARVAQGFLDTAVKDFKHSKPAALTSADDTGLRPRAVACAPPQGSSLQPELSSQHLQQLFIFGKQHSVLTVRFCVIMVQQYACPASWLRMCEALID